MINWLIDLVIEMFESGIRITVCILILIIFCVLLGRVADTDVGGPVESNESISGEMQ